ncbi:MAG TPA: porin family protein [Flavipsychrobacter sp.]|nr:porin family protein [Flavipsychrobacter sp.]
MKNLFLSIFVITTLNAAGQDHIIGVKAGVNWTNASTDFLSHTDYRTGVTTGLTYEYLFNRFFSVGADFSYNQRGFTTDLFFANSVWPFALQSQTIKYNYNYLSLPLKAGLNIGNKLYGFMNIGAVPSLLVKARTMRPIFNANGEKTGNETFDATSIVKKLDFAGLAEIGAGYKIDGRFRLYTSFAYQRSFTTITNSEYFSGSKIEHYGMTLVLGLKYTLPKQTREQTKE